LAVSFRALSFSRRTLAPSPERLLALPHRWRDEAVRAGGNITRIGLAFEPGRENAAEIGREIEFLTVNPV